MSEHEVLGTETIEDKILWEQNIMTKINEIGFGNYVEAIPNLPDAFDQEKQKFFNWLCCVDGRTPCGKHLPGSGVSKNIEDMVNLIKENGIKNITWHKECGAAGIEAKNNTGKEELSEEEINNFAQQSAERIAEKAGITCSEMKIEGEHNERVCYLDKTNKFDHSLVKDLPNGFTVSELKGINKGEILDSIKLCISIAFGKHSFGDDFFSKENPFIVVVVANTNGEIEESKRELDELVKTFNGKVVIDGFVKPFEKIDS